MKKPDKQNWKRHVQCNRIGERWRIKDIRIIYENIFAKEWKIYYFESWTYPWQQMDGLDCDG